MKEILIYAGLLNPWTGFMLVKGIDGETALLTKWRKLIPGIHMRVERIHFNETICWPIFPKHKPEETT